MTFEEREKRIQSLMNRTEKLKDAIAVLYIDAISFASERHCYIAQLRETDENPTFYDISLSPEVFEGFFEDKTAVDTPAKLESVVKSLKDAEFGIILDAEGWKALREECIQRADSSGNGTGKRAYTLKLQEVEDIFLMYAGNFEEE